MHIKDVPQDIGMAGNQREVCYAVGPDGRYILAPSLGWTPKNIANAQAWALIEDDVKAAWIRVRSGCASPLAYHMVRYLMDIKLLAQYTGFFRWQVRWHLTPRGFARLSDAKKQRYANVFGISVNALLQIPDSCCIDSHRNRPDRADTL